MQAVRVVERTSGIPVGWFESLAPHRFVRIVRITIENDGGEPPWDPRSL